MLTPEYKFRDVSRQLLKSIKSSSKYELWTCWKVNFHKCSGLQQGHSREAERYCAWGSTSLQGSYKDWQIEGLECQSCIQIEKKKKKSHIDHNCYEIEKQE